MPKQKTIGALKKSGYKSLPIKEEIRNNLIRKMRNGEKLFPGILGFEKTVIPQIENAILAGQDIIFLGERGQAKSRMIRGLVSLLDEEVPVIANCEINDDPFAPICSSCKDAIENEGDKVAIEWMARDLRYGEKLATPDITIADLIGEVDPIKVAEGRYLSDEFTIHYGLVPRSHRGVFCINELPDLSERIQVGLLNIMEERDVQIKGYKVRLPLDVYLVASANPEDYTNRGRIITPLKDRYGSQIRTHYPQEIEEEIKIMDQERLVFGDVEDLSVDVPEFMKEIVAEFSNLARHSPDVNQRSGVSVRVSIDNFETLISNAERRAIRINESTAAPRVSDLAYITTSTMGKIELESLEDGRENHLIEDLTKKAVLNVFNRRFNIQEFDDFLTKFDEGLAVDVSDMMASTDYSGDNAALQGLDQAVDKLGSKTSPATVASAIEFILEGLHLNRKLNKDKHEAGMRYKS
ncbi:sigma 54-interacting transcriptional regulator [Dehalococcoidia bacterium]|nr:sigma 54-interacting transcriptional regulator [Dehalococcoidia bacterium]